MSCPAVIDVYAATGPVVAEVVTPGPPGPVGSRWLVGSAVPTSGVGAVGDYYLRGNGDVYGPKATGGWGSVQFALSGPPGASAPVYAIRIDAATPGTVYVGRASVGSSEAATVWTIRRRTFSAAGVLLTTGTATGAWSNRTNLTYT